MTDKTTHKPGCEALGGYGHGIGPCSCSEAQPEALYVAEQLDATRHAFGDDNAQSKRRASAELRRQHAELQQLKGQLTTQTNRAAAAEQQVTALTQRLDMANRLNTDARNQLAQLTEKNAWLEDEMRSQCNIHGIAAEREATRMTQNQRMHERIAELEAQLSARQAAPDGWRLVPVEPTQAMTAAGCPVGEAVDYFDMGTAYRAMLSASPPPPEREPLSQHDLERLVGNWFAEGWAKKAAFGMLDDYERTRNRSHQ